MRIRIGHLSTFYHTAILLMAKGEVDARLGEEVEWKLIGTGPAIMQAFQRRELDLAYIGLPPAIIGMAQGIDIICVAGGHMEGTVMTGKAHWLGHADGADLRAVLQQFRGRRIGVPGKGSIHDVILKDSIERYDLGSDVEIVNYPWADLVIEAVVHDEVSAAFGTPALAVAINRFAGGKMLYPPSLLWPSNPSYGIVADRGFLQAKGKTVERFLLLHEEATAFMRHQPSDAARMIADFVGIIDREFVQDTLSVSPKYCAQLTGDYIASTMKFVPVLKKRGYIDSDVQQNRIFSREIIDRIHPEREHYDDGIAMAG
ncbi:MAG TPA: ABC transporter substrate-binding protein [Nitrospirota bacterium]|nr:ABC transporter substrate-binding protein [Nitrospirota bacterium]